MSRTRPRGTAGEVLEVHVSESTPGGSEVVFWLGSTDGGTYLLPMDSEEEALVYATYKHDGGRTGLYVDSVREVDVRPPAPGEAASTETRPPADEFPDSEETGLDGPAPGSEHRSVR